MLWKAPELLADDAPDKSKEGDVYSYGIILSEILTREDPYADYNMDAKGKRQFKTILESFCLLIK